VETADQLVRVLQTAISPVVLISGVGLLVLSITNRFSRTTERARGLAALRADADPLTLARVDTQIRILYRRSKILLWSTSSALVSALLASLLIMTLFVTYLGAADLHLLVVALFVSSLASLVLSLVLYILDMTLALNALREELGDARK
jgi:hypothetical protein